MKRRVRMNEIKSKEQKLIEVGEDTIVGSSSTEVTATTTASNLLDVDLKFTDLEELDKQNYCTTCRDTYQFGNFTSRGNPYDSLKINFPRYDEYFEISKFYSDNGYLTINQVNVLLNYLTEDFSKSKLISFEDIDDTEDSDERTILISRVKNIRAYERLFRKKRVKYCPSLISCWTILTKLRESDKFGLALESVDWSFYTNLFDASKDVIGYDTYSGSSTKSHCDTPNVSLIVHEDIAWFWKPVEDPIVFPRGRLLLANHYGFDLPFYMSLFYQNYNHLTTIHLHFIHCSTIFSKHADRLPMLTVMSKVWFDSRSTKASRWKLAMEQYLQDALEFSRAEIYYHLLHNSILRIWRHVSTRKFVNKYLALFDSHVRKASAPNIFRADFKIRSYVFARIMQYRFSRSRKFNANQIRIVTNFFEKWLREGLYQMAYPCSFFVSRKKLWNELIMTKHANYDEFPYLDRMTALRNLPSINLMRRDSNRTYCRTIRSTNFHGHYSSTDATTIASTSTSTSTSFAETGDLVLPSTTATIVDATRDDRENSVNFTTRCNALRLSLDPNNDDKIMRFFNILFFTNNPSEVFSVSYVKLKLYYDFDRQNLTTDTTVLKIWDDSADALWTSDRLLRSRVVDTTLDSLAIYKFVETILSNFLNPKFPANINLLLQRREIGGSGDFKTLNFTNWKDNGFEKQCEILDAPLYVNKYFFEDILKLMSLFLLK